MLVDADRTHQTIDGREFTTRVWEMDKANNVYSGLWLTYRDKIIDALANDIGFNRIRLELPSGLKNPEEYAELVEGAFIRLRDKYGVVPDAFEVILEPDNSLDWRGPEIANGLLAVAKRLDAFGIDPDYIAPSTSKTTNAPRYFDSFAKNKEALKRLDVLSYHRYDWKRAKAALPKIISRARKANISTAMLKYENGVIINLFEDLIEGEVVAWQKYGVPFMPVRTPDAGEELLAPELGMAKLSQVFRNVRRGAVRLHTATLDGSARAMAFRNKNGAHTIFILSEGTGDIEIKGVPDGKYAVSFSAHNRTSNLGTRTVEVDASLRIKSDQPGLFTLLQTGIATD